MGLLLLHQDILKAAKHQPMPAAQASANLFNRTKDTSKDVLGLSVKEELASCETGASLSSHVSSQLSTGKDVSPSSLPLLMPVPFSSSSSESEKSTLPVRQSKPDQKCRCYLAAAFLLCWSAHEYEPIQAGNILSTYAPIVQSRDCNQNRLYAGDLLAGPAHQNRVCGLQTVTVQH